MNSVFVTRASLLLLTVLMLSWVSPVYADDYAFESYKSDLETKVNNVARQGWEVVDVTFTNFYGYAVIYRRTQRPGVAPNTYSFDVASYQNAEAKTNQAARNGWEMYKLVSCSERLCCLCFRRGPQYAYRFETSVGRDVATKANAASRQGWQLCDLGFGGVSGYLMCYRRAPYIPKHNFVFIAPNMAQVQAQASDGGSKGFEMIRMVSCIATGTQSLYGLAFQYTGQKQTYSFEWATQGNVEAKANDAAKQGWHVYGLVGDASGDIDYAESSDIVRSGAPYVLCLRR